MLRVQRGGRTAAWGMLSAIGALVVCAGSAQACPPTYTLTVLPTSVKLHPSEEYSRAFDINQSGLVVGSESYYAFKWDAKNGTRSLAPSSSGYEYKAYGVNNDGWIAGWIGQGENGDAVLFGPAGQAIALASEYPSLHLSVATAVNDARTIVGKAVVNMGPFDPYTAVSWLSPSSDAQQLASCPPWFPSDSWEKEYPTDINNSGRQVGVAHSCDPSQSLLAYYWDMDEPHVQGIQPLDGDVGNVATSVNDVGDVVGYSWAKNDQSDAKAFVRLVDGTVMALGAIAGGDQRSYPHGINSGLEVVGATADGLEGVAWRWSPSDGMRDLNMDIADRGAWVVVEARGINDAGMIAATARHRKTGVYRAVVLTPNRSSCPAEWNCDSVLNSADFFAFLLDFFEGRADFNADGVTNSSDFFDFLTVFFDGCQ